MQNNCIFILVRTDLGGGRDLELARLLNLLEGVLLRGLFHEQLFLAGLELLHQTLQQLDDFVGVVLVGVGVQARRVLSAVHRLRDQVLQTRHVQARGGGEGLV